MATVRKRMLMACESFLRVPPLLIIDEIFRINFGLGNFHKRSSPSGLIPVKTTLVPDRLELSDEEQLETDYNNETVLATSFPSSSELNSSSQPPSSSFPRLDELWTVISDTLYNVFNTDAHNQDASSSLANAVSSSVPPSTIVEETGPAVATSTYQSPTDLIGGYERSAPQIVAADLMKIPEVLLCIALFFVAVITFMLATENLIKLYSHLLSFLSLYVSYIFTPFPAPLALTTLPSLLYNLGCRSLFAGTYHVCRSWPGGYNPEGQNTLVSTLTEIVLIAIFFVTGAVRIHPVLYVILMIALHHPLIRCIPKIHKFLKESWNETKRIQNEYGLSHLIQVESGRLRVNTVFRLFWVTRAAYDAVSKCCNEPLNSMIRYVMTHGTETFTGIVGLTVTVSAICHHIGEGLLFLLYNGTNTEADANRFGSISTVLFFILSLQTGLTSLDPEKRLDRLMKNIVLLGTALFHALHQMISPVLTAFRAFQSLQIRAAVLSCSFFLMSVFLTYYLVSHSIISTWSLAVLALAIEFKIKIVISLLISFVVYLSQLVQYPEMLEKFLGVCRRRLPTFIVRFFDNLHDEWSHEDVVFFLRSVANVTEFLTGIFLFVNAVWIFCFESASAIRAIGMSVHAYFNIWCEAQKGWKVYQQRKTASQKIMSLADATEDQLRARQDDVCAVCYEEMESAKVTNCNHLFHAVCLRKWLYVQNTCPLCHEVLYREEALQRNENDGDEEPRQTDNVNPNEDTNHPRASTSTSSSTVNSARQNRSEDDSDDTDPDVRLPTNNNNSDVAATSSRPVTSRYPASRRESSQSSSYNGARFYDRHGEAEAGNSSSGTEYTVDDGSDGEWVEEFSSSDDDEVDEIVRRHRERGDGIGVPLLL